jgi:predicted dehydrogenase
VTLGVAIIGCGLVGAKRAAALPAEARLVCVYDPDRDRGAALAVGTALVAGTVEEAIGASGVELVIVAVPHGELPEIAVAALEAGRHVLVEKPGAADLAGAERIAAAARENGCVARVGFNHRFHPSLLRAREIVRAADHGRVMFIRGRYGHGGRIGYEKEWRADAAISGGGELIDQGVHLIDLTRFLAGDASLAYSDLRTTFWPMAVEDNAFLALECASGALAWLHASWTEWKNLFSLEIMLERAKIDISGLGGSYGTEALTLYEMQPGMGPPPMRYEEWRSGDDSWQRELNDVVSVVAGGAGIGASVEDAVAALRIVDDAYKRRP